MKGQYKSLRLALQGLCSVDVQNTGNLALVEKFIRDSREERPIVDSAITLLRNVLEDVAVCDTILGRHSHRWKLSRLALIDRNILRLATYELRVKQIPYKVVITDAIKLASEFSTAESPRFINGVLDAVAHELNGTDSEQDGQEHEECHDCNAN